METLKQTPQAEQSQPTLPPRFGNESQGSATAMEQPAPDVAATTQSSETTTFDPAQKERIAGEWAAKKAREDLRGAPIPLDASKLAGRVARSAASGIAGIMSEQPDSRR